MQTTWFRVFLKREAVEVNPVTSMVLTKVLSLLAMAYVALALSTSALIDLDSRFLISWSMFDFRWWVTFDPYSFFAWFVVPFLVLLVFGKIDFQWFSLKRAQKVDFVIFLGIILIGALAISLIPLFPSLSSYYESYGERALDFKLLYAKRHLIWLSCWLFPWEFLTRYVLLKSSVKLNSRWGWLFVPLFELGYHLIKPWPEAVGMLFFSLFLTIWTMRRKSLMPAFIAHLIIELELLAFLLLV